MKYDARFIFFFQYSIITFQNISHVISARESMRYEERRNFCHSMRTDWVIGLLQTLQQINARISREVETILILPVAFGLSWDICSWRRWHDGDSQRSYIMFHVSCVMYSLESKLLKSSENNTLMEIWISIMSTLYNRISITRMKINSIKWLSLEQPSLS